MRQLGERPKKSRHFLKIFLLTIFLSLLTFGGFKLLNLDNFFFKGPKAVVRLITESGLKSEKGRTNILLLGIGGDGHEGPNLTDTMILASVDKNDGDVVLISIPRDLWVPSLKSKINAAYAFGQEKDGKGLELAESTVSELFGLPIHYAVRLDFGGFVKAVDLVDGLDINVDNTFSDYRYPIEGKENDTCGLKVEIQDKDGVKETFVKDATGAATVVTEENDPFTCRYETLSFKQGPSHLDGGTALKFVRSRHGNNGEGTDFARSARQEKVIVAFREKVFSTKTLLDPKTITSLATTFGKSIDTDITNDDLPLFLKLATKVEKTNIRKVVPDSGKEDSRLAVGDPSIYGGFVLLPKNNSWTDFAEYIQTEVYIRSQKTVGE